ncbi:Sodium/potassium-transporting ATPase subunit alpha-1 [Wickerhamiella sorbophila]|uniref:Sodium/potassium-transporting ATPase subunit alpha-1 n=1 Tax=Wickerhamiella sorbophila TaxID=45607 RepID=A0A2T0FNS9_9ASCO|nr:Sodium/potassium-transporting ATPase subunit alpha-1 [Wickerhamiella sorbophila]PRT56644.1 Sodium/potassium-transporting ATPase subunit alpha-1 [Wickerhamiella sorbophila]
MSDSSSFDEVKKERTIVFHETPRRPSNGVGFSRTDTIVSRLSRSSHLSELSGVSGRVMDPSVAMPVTYQSVSYTVEASQEKGKPATVPTANDKTVEAVAALEWHTLSVSQVFDKLESSELGLSQKQIKEKQSQFGRNVLSKAPRHTLRKIFWYFFGGFGTILFTGGILVMISWRPLGDPPAQSNLALSIVLFCVFLIQAAFNAWQDYSSSRVMSSITGMLPEACITVRDGTQQQTEAADIVPGDIIFFKAGNKLPADVRFIEVSSDAKFDRSILTGESLPLGATVGMTDENYMETRNIGMQGTYCTSGSGKAVVVSTSDDTVFGRIAKLTSTPNKRPSPIQTQIRNFVMIILCLMLTMIAIVLIVWGAYLRSHHPEWIPTAALIVDIVSVGIAFVPEGLPVAMTSSLTICANAMKKNNILCKSLSTVETLGCVSVLLSDKTGTLTKNQMKAVNCTVGTKSINLEEAIDGAKDRENPYNNALHQLETATAICNAAEFDATTSDLDIEDRTILGDATDQACLRFSEQLGSVSYSRELWDKRFDLAFNSKNKYMLRLFSSTSREAFENTVSPEEASTCGEKSWLLVIKGAPDILLDRCSSYVTEQGAVAPLSEDSKHQLEEVKNKWSSDGKRVIAVARKILRPTDFGDPRNSEFEDEAKELASHGLCFVGFVGILDPPRVEIPGVVETLRGAGIRVMMVTGDFKLTAQAIARQCNIITADFVDNAEDLLVNTERERKALVLSGAELNDLDEGQWAVVCQYEEIVFARTTPEQKLEIVKQFQAAENIVGMTGDGVNDSPSLKQADIGIAPEVAADMALEAADMILLDDFSAIVQAVLFGRTAYDNLKKTIAYLLPAGTFSEFWPVMTNICFGLPQVLSSFLMIIICCFTDAGVGIVLAYEKPEADLLLRPPRSKKDYLVDWRLLLWSYGFMGVCETVLSFTMSYWYCQRSGLYFSDLWFKFGQVPAHMTPERYNEILKVASSIYFSNLVIMQWFVSMAARTRRMSVFTHPPLFNKNTQNWRIFVTIPFSFAIIWIFCYPKDVQQLFYSADIPVEHWFLPMALGLGLLSMDEIRKCLVRRYPNGLLAKCAW